MLVPRIGEIIGGSQREDNLEMLDKRMDEMKLDKQGQVVEGANQLQKMMSFFGPFGVALLLTISIFSASGYLLQSASEEKQNRVIEVILSSVKPDQLLAVVSYVTTLQGTAPKAPKPPQGVRADSAAQPPAG